MSTFNKYRTKGAYHYQWYETEDWYKWAVDSCVKFCKGPTIDIGCGDGVLLSKLPLGSVGLDSDKHALELCEQRGLATTYCDLEKSKPIVWGEEFDYVASINTIEHITNTDMFMKFVRAARKGAIIITIDYQGGSLGEDHRFEWTYGQMMDFFKEFDPKGFRYKDTEWIGVEILK